MWDRIKAALWLVETPKDGEGRLSRLLFHLDLLLIGAMGLFLGGALTLFSISGARLIYVWMLLCVSVIILPLFRLNRRRAASLLLALALWVLQTGAVLQGGIRSYYFSSYLFILLAVGFLIDLRAMGLLSLLTILAGSALAYAESSGRWLPVLPPTQDVGIVSFLQIVILLTNICVGLYAIYYFRKEQRRASTELLQRKQAQTLLEEKSEALRQNQEMLAGMTEHIPGVVFRFFSAKDGKYGFTYVSPQVKTILGLELNLDTLYDQFFKHLDPAYREPCYRSMQEAIKQARFWFFEARFLRPDGKALWLRILSTPSQQENELVFNGLLLDVTEHKEAEMALFASEKKYREILESIRDVYFRIDLNGRLTMISPSGVSALGFKTADEILGKPLADFWADPDRASLDRQMIFAKGGMNDYEVPLRQREGTIFVVSLNIHRVSEEGEWVGHEGVWRDITDRKKNETALRESEKAYRALFEQSPNEILVIRAGGEIVDANERFLLLSGFSRAQVIGKTLIELGVCTSEQLMHNFREISKADRSINQSELVLKTMTNTYRTVLVAAKAIEIQGELLLLLILTDISARKRMESDLQSSERRYRTVVEQLYEAFCLVDETGHFIEWNRAMEQITGIPREEALGMSFLDMQYAIMLPERRTPERLNSIREMTEQALQTGKARFLNQVVEITIRDRAGHIHYVQNVSFPIHTEKGYWIGILSQDITQRKQAEFALQDSELLYRTLFEQSPYEVTVSKVSGEYIDVNERACWMWGRSKEEILGKTPVELGKLSAEQFRWLQMQAEKNGQELNQQEISFQREDGSCRHILISAKQILFGGEPRIVSILNDITGRKLAEETLRESERKLSALLGNLPGMAYRCLNQTGRPMTFISMGCFDLTGYLPAEFTGPQGILFGSLLHPDEGEQVEVKIQDAVNKHIPYQVLYQITTKSGMLKWIWDKGQGVFAEDGSLLALEGLAIDVTERIRAEEEVQRLNTELEQRVYERTTQLTLANQELESFAYSVSHDLRAPLRAMDGFSQILAEEYRECLNEEGQKYIERIRKNAQRMGQLIDDLLRLSRTTQAEIHWEWVDLSALVIEIEMELRAANPKRAAEFVVAPDIHAQADRALMQVALSNLLGNAWKFTGSHPAARIEFGQTRVEGQTVFFVRDDGVGFDVAYSTRLFGAFQRLHDQSVFPGTGIGLAIVQRIIRRHGGHIWAESEVEHGATFYFTLGAPD